MRVSVAVKLVFFFGLSIVAVVMAALAVPWAWMQSLADELAVQAARKAALVAYARVGMPDTADWSQKQEQLDKWWPQLGRQTEGAPADAPRLIQIDPASRKPPEEADAFLLSAIDYLRSHPGKREWTREFHSKNGRFYRYRRRSARASCSG
jgi:hypothetical protein